MMETAVVARGVTEHRKGIGPGNSLDAEWAALFHAFDVATALGERDIILIGDALTIIKQAKLHPDFAARAAGFSRVRLRHIARTQNLAGIALAQARGLR